MKILATLYESFEMEWRIHVNPKGLKNDNPNERRPIITFWTPNNEPQSRMLIYNPKIALVGRMKRMQTEETVYIPINQLYAFANKLSLVYQGLSADSLKKRDGNHLYIDKNQALRLSQKMNLFNKNLVITPTVLTPYDTEVLGVQMTVGGKFACSMPHSDIREFCEILTHTDVQVYSLILSMMETIDNMDQKMDRILATQNEILSLLKGNGHDHIRMNGISQPTGAGLQWERMR